MPTSQHHMNLGDISGKHQQHILNNFSFIMSTFERKALSHMKKSTLYFTIIGNISVMN